MTAPTGFVVVAEPTTGADRATPTQWLPSGGLLGALLVGCLAVAAVRRGTVRAVLLAVATALLYGVTAALTKGVVSLLDGGLLALTTAWETPALVIAAVGGTLLSQSAFQTGGLTASLPIITVGEPVVGVALGAAVLGEQVQVDGLEWLLFPVLVVAMVAATAALAHSAAVDQAARSGADGVPTPPTARGTSSSPSSGTARKPSAPA